MRLASFVLLWSVALAGGACMRDPAAPATAPATLVGRTSRQFADETRRAWIGSGPRPLAVLLWYPASPESRESDWFIGPPAAPLFRAGRSALNAPPLSTLGRPLILLSHGTGGSAVMLAWLGEALARAGFVVAAVNHHGNTSAEAVPTPEGFVLWWERATDLSRLVDVLVRDPEFGPRIDVDRIGAAGFSLGGYTALAVAGARADRAHWAAFCGGPRPDATCAPQPEFPEAIAQFESVRDRDHVRASLARHAESYGDARIRAVFAVAPVGTWLTEQSLRTVAVPVRVVVGTRDTTTPTANNASRIAQLIPGAALSAIEGAGHYTFLAECEPQGLRLRPDLCHDAADVQRAIVHRRVAAAAVTFFAEILNP